MQKLRDYKGYELWCEEYDDSDGFHKNHWEIYDSEGNFLSHLSGFTYTSAGVYEAFVEIVEEKFLT